VSVNRAEATEAENKPNQTKTMKQTKTPCATAETKTDWERKRDRGQKKVEPTARTLTTIFQTLD